MDICTQDPCPVLDACCGSSSLVSAGPCCARLATSAAATVFSTSAFTPTMACVPSANPTRALPFVPGRMSVSAVSGRNWVGERPSGRMGLFGRASEVYR